MAQHSIKGTLFSGVIDDVQRLLAAGTLGRDALEARVGPEFSQLLDEKVEASKWYDLDAYESYVEVLEGTEGKDDPDYLFARGQRAADRLIKANIYAQLDYLGRMDTRSIEDSSERMTAYGRDLRLIISIQAALVDFGDWNVRVDPELEDRYRIEVSNVDGVRNRIFKTAEGFFCGLARTASSNSERSWIFERTSPSLAIFRMAQSL